MDTYAAYGDLEWAMRQRAGNSESAFARQNGRSLWEVLAADPVRERNFSQSMGCIDRLSALLYKHPIYQRSWVVSRVIYQHLRGGLTAKHWVEVEI